MNSRIARIFRWIYALAAGLFLAGVVVQVFLAGRAAVTQSSGWGEHADFGDVLGFPLLLMLASMFFGRIPRRERWLTAVLFLIYFVQADVIIFMRSSDPYVAAAHPVLALFDFLLGLRLLRSSLDALKSNEFRKIPGREENSLRREKILLGKEA